MIEPILERHPHVETLKTSAQSLEGRLCKPAEFFSEEERSRQPSIFSILRAVSHAFQTSNENGGHFGFYGAFGYDLVLEFEDINLKHQRPANAKDCHLLLPLEIFVVDRKRETANRFSYSIKTPKGMTADLPAGGAKFNLEPAKGSEEVACDHLPGDN